MPDAVHRHTVETAKPATELSDAEKTQHQNSQTHEDLDKGMNLVKSLLNDFLCFMTELALVS